MIPNGPGCYGPHRRVPRPEAWLARAAVVAAVAVQVDEAVVAVGQHALEAGVEIGSVSLASGNLHVAGWPDDDSQS